MSDRGHVETVRAIVFVLPLAVLTGSMLGPPDPFGHLVLIGLTVVVGVPLAKRVLPLATYRPLTIGTFYLVVALVVLVGIWASSALPIERYIPSIVARTVVLGIGLAAGYRLTLGGPDR